MAPLSPFRSVRPEELSRRDRYQLLTSLVVPRPIGWISTRSAQGVPNLAPFSYFAALSAEPMLLGISVGHRRDGRPKDTLLNIRESGVFTVSLVTRQHLEPMNASAATFEPGISEFDAVGIEAAQATTVSAPFVADAPATLECRLDREIDLGSGATALLIGEVLGIRLRGDLQPEPGSTHVDVSFLEPIGRLQGSWYAPVSETLSLERPSEPKPPPGD